MKSKEQESNGDKQGKLILVLMGEVLTKHRKLRKMSQTELANLASVNRPYISDIERGRRNVSLLTLNSICLALNRGPAEILQEVYVLLQSEGPKPSSVR